MKQVPRRIAAAAGLLLAAGTALAGTGLPKADLVFANGYEQPPNILLVILDDVGVDQMPSFGYGGANPPPMPTIDAIAGAGLRFRNAWSMPECSPGRSTLFTGRYPLRTGIYQAIGPSDLANSQVNPFEVTLPRLLDHAGHVSGMFGKGHLGGPENNPAGYGALSALGWDHFHGWIDGVPASIDTTAGGIAPSGTYSCGFVPSTAQDPVNGADSGACYTRTGDGIACSVISGSSAQGDPPGLQCLTRGGILVPNAGCEVPAPAYLDWHTQNAHYVSSLVINDGDDVQHPGETDPRSRGYRATLEVDAASAWIRAQQQAGRRWMATVSFSNAHTPMQTPPGHLLSSGSAAHLAADCSAGSGNTPNLRRLYDAMIEATDTELRRLLLETGLARPDGNGGLVYDPAATDTMIVIVGDNGSFGPTVKLPFDPMRAKGTAYQTGVWVPLIVAGPVVAQPGRAVEHMVNTVDVFRLFGELAGIDVPAAVPRPIDGTPMHPYLVDPQHPSIRAFNFTGGGLNLQANGGRNGPCVFDGLCSHTPMSRAVCEDNGGVWWGEGADPGQVIVGDLEHCWQVNQAIYHNDPAGYEQNRVEIAALDYRAIRNGHFKLVRNWALDFDPVLDTGVEVTSEELYLVNQDQPGPLLDRAALDLLADGKLTPVQAIEYARLVFALQALEASEVPCPGDGNIDGRVDQADIDNFHAITASWNGSSVYDFNLDGLTDAADLQIIEANLGATCFTRPP